MERGLAEAIAAAVPCPFRVTRQPEPEKRPVDHAERLTRLRLRPGADIRADLTVTPPSGRRLTFDVCTVNGLCASALLLSSAAAQLSAIEREKNSRYSAYYTNFKPFVVTLSGAVTDASHLALRAVAREAAKACDWAMDWEPARWVDNILHRVSVSMIRAVTCVAMCSSAGAA
jgi:hypothetical protein